LLGRADEQLVGGGDAREDKPCWGHVFAENHEPAGRSTMPN
jgi:hypothetical protein